MKYKNIFFGLCASMIIASEISAMQLVTRRVPKSKHRINSINSMMRKNFCCGGDEFLIFVSIVGVTMFAIYVDSITASPCIQTKVEKKIMQAQKIQEFKLKTPEVKLLTDRSQEQLSLKNKQDIKSSDFNV
jgi:hypothetical protein